MTSLGFHKYNSVDTDINDIDLDQYNPSILTPKSKQVYKQWEMDKNDELLIDGYFRTCNITEHHLSTDILRSIAQYYTKGHSKGSLKRRILELQKRRDREIRRRKQKMKSGLRHCLQIFGVIILLCFPFAVDIAALIIIGKYDCDAILNSNTKLSNLGIESFLSSGSIAHLVVVPILVVFWGTVTTKHGLRSDSWYYYSFQKKCVMLICVVSFALVTFFFISWSIIGSILYSNIIQPNPYKACSKVLISWIVIKFIMYLVIAPFMFCMAIATNSLMLYYFFWTFSVFAINCGADIAGLVVVTNNNCDSSILKGSQFISFGVDTYLLYGCGVHLAIEVLFLCLLSLIVSFGESGNFIGYHDKAVVKTAVCIAVTFGLMSVSWSVIGCLLYSEMNKNTASDKQCADVTIAWIVVRFAEFLLVQPVHMWSWIIFFSYFVCYTS